MSVNKAIFIGRLGKDPEVKHLDGGATVASFSLATSEKYTAKNGEKVEFTDWHNIVVWNKLAEIVEKYVKRGMMVYIEGKLKTRSWEKDGQKHYTTEIFADTIQMLSSSGQQSSNEQQNNPTREQKSQERTAAGTPADIYNPPIGDDNDLPF